MLAYFRSQHRGQSGSTALGVVLDAATLASACIVGADEREPPSCYRRGRRAVIEIGARLGLRVNGDTFLDRELFGYAHGLLAGAGLVVHPVDDAWARLQGLRRSYGPNLQALMDHLVAPAGFWGHASEGTLAEPQLNR